MERRGLRPGVTQAVQLRGEPGVDFGAVLAGEPHRFTGYQQRTAFGGTPDL